MFCSGSSDSRLGGGISRFLSASARLRALPSRLERRGVTQIARISSREAISAKNVSPEPFSSLENAARGKIRKCVWRGAS